MAEKLKQMSGAVSIEEVEEVLLDRKQKSSATSIPVKNIQEVFFGGILRRGNGTENHRAIGEMEAGGRA